MPFDDGYIVQMRQAHLRPEALDQEAEKWIRHFCLGNAPFIISRNLEVLIRCAGYGVPLNINNLQDLIWYASRSRG